MGHHHNNNNKKGNQMKKFTGKEIQDQFCKIGINALWIKNLGMIFMPNSYGTDIAAAEPDRKFVNAIASAACAKLLPQISEARAKSAN